MYWLEYGAKRSYGLSLPWLHCCEGKDVKNNEDEKVGGKENGVGSEVEVQAEGNSTYLFLCHPIHSLSSSENYS